MRQSALVETTDAVMLDHENKVQGAGGHRSSSVHRREALPPLIHPQTHLSPEWKPYL